MGAGHSGSVMADLRHLSSRFFKVLGAQRLSPREQAEAEALLEEPERDLFWSQHPADQRHALGAAKSVLIAAPGRRDLARACLLHDVGKNHAALGVFGRTLATLVEILRLPRTSRMDLYLRHCELGADDLAAVGSEDLVVAFARFHHQAAPPGVDSADWALMVAADE